ncbi:unnamed protein product [Owenia fusiformis]|uniref:Uncharacterized protein n=1 Tax=Owenia fusiformis TaxID=6347 RepID=A0A8J1UEP0_OWEFU|nr:unnamed protein product [Owenia fusiformis]
MAEAMPLNMTEDEAITCPMCFEDFSNLIPKILQCGHTFCHHCLERYQQTAPSFRIIKCPTCRINTELRDGVVENLPTNFLVKEIAYAKKFTVTKPKSTISHVPKKDDSIAIVELKITLTLERTKQEVLKFKQYLNSYIHTIALLMVARFNKIRTASLVEETSYTNIKKSLIDARQHIQTLTNNILDYSRLDNLASPEHIMNKYNTTRELLTKLEELKPPATFMGKAKIVFTNIFSNIFTSREGRSYIGSTDKFERLRETLTQILQIFEFTKSSSVKLTELENDIDDAIEIMNLTTQGQAKNLMMEWSIISESMQSRQVALAKEFDEFEINHKHIVEKLSDIDN